MRAGSIRGGVGLSSTRERLARMYPERHCPELRALPEGTEALIVLPFRAVQLQCGSRQHLVGETLTSLEARLDPARFRRIHRCRMVNLSRVVSLHPLLSSCYELELQNGFGSRAGGSTETRFRN